MNKFDSFQISLDSAEVVLSLLTKQIEQLNERRAAIQAELNRLTGAKNLLESAIRAAQTNQHLFSVLKI